MAFPIAAWSGLSANPSDLALDLLEVNVDKIDWVKLSRNSNDRAIKLLRENSHKINKYQLSKNPNAMELIDHTTSYMSAKNPNPKVICSANYHDWNIYHGNIYYFEKILDHIYFETLYNKYGISDFDPYVRFDEPKPTDTDELMIYELFTQRGGLYYETNAYTQFKKNIKLPRNRVAEFHKKYPRLTNWKYISKNADETLIPFLQKNLHRTCSRYLSANPNMLKFFIEEPGRLEGTCLLNPNLEIFNLYDDYYHRLKEAKQHLFPNHSVLILRDNLATINWKKLSRNPNSEAIKLLSENQLDIKWDKLALNINAKELLRDNLDKLSKKGWYNLGLTHPDILSI